MLIEFISQLPTVDVNGFRIVTAPSIAEMHAVLGKPSRIDAGLHPAPASHRNNQIHIYDELGITFHEHHYTRLVQNVQCWFQTSDPVYNFTPRRDYSGSLILDGIQMPIGGKVEWSFEHLPITFSDGFGGSWQYKVNDFSVFVSSRGKMLPSKRRSKIKQITSISFSWPHDNRQPPPS